MAMLFRKNWKYYDRLFAKAVRQRFFNSSYYGNFAKSAESQSISLLKIYIVSLKPILTVSVESRKGLKMNFQVHWIQLTFLLKI